jgi:hypothetical protein
VTLPGCKRSPRGPAGLASGQGQVDQSARVKLTCPNPGPRPGWREPTPLNMAVASFFGSYNLTVFRFLLISLKINLCARLKVEVKHNSGDLSVSKISGHHCRA